MDGTGVCRMTSFVFDIKYHFPVFEDVKLRNPGIFPKDIGSRL